MVNCNENAYIANYRKMGKPLEYKRNTNERVKLSTFPPIVSRDETGYENELPMQPISSIRSSKRLIKPTHDVEKKKKIQRSKGKKVSLPNDVAPIIVMPITHYDDYDWKVMILVIILRIFLAPT